MIASGAADLLEKCSKIGCFLVATRPVFHSLMENSCSWMVLAVISARGSIEQLAAAIVPTWSANSHIFLVSCFLQLLQLFFDCSRSTRSCFDLEIVL